MGQWAFKSLPSYLIFMGGHCRIIADSDSGLVLYLPSLTVYTQTETVFVQSLIPIVKELRRHLSVYNISQVSLVERRKGTLKIR
jgi:hypothetical protein